MLQTTDLKIYNLRSGKVREFAFEILVNTRFLLSDINHPVSTTVNLDNALAADRPTRRCAKK